MCIRDRSIRIPKYTSEYTLYSVDKLTLILIIYYLYRFLILLLSFILTLFIFNFTFIVMVLFFILDMNCIDVYDIKYICKYFAGKRQRKKR